MKLSIATAAALLLLGGQAKTTQDGIYSEAQAARGEAVYTKSCASCHGADLSGSGQAPALGDADFNKEWDGQPVADLFERIHTTMPGDAPGSLQPADVADVTAFLLSKCHMPAGQAELPSDSAALKTITFSAPKQ